MLPIDEPACSFSHPARRERPRTLKSPGWRPEPSSIWEMAITDTISSTEVQSRIWGRAPLLTATSWAAREVTWCTSPAKQVTGRDTRVRERRHGVHAIDSGTERMWMRQCEWVWY